ncbi:ly6/PLAUR domain-containing protein 6 [Protopterus annectens]|uniref:ly6/PLAUR domain-containing protein 6 n=1 Tax=Protopterus annectens TaxID=7888 RepID=UPI001CFB28A8|nr:ly6/PLAUR domain-containing protein 6 [Protopterus annectens]
MKSWPALAWVIILNLIDNNLKVVYSRDFTMNDIIYLYPSTTPYPGGFKCFTCENQPDNYQCNRWAPDEYCPKESRYCYTSHTMNATGESVSVTKRCATLEKCVSTGCTVSRHTRLKTCTSCCEGNICNIRVPGNSTDAVFATKSPLNRTTAHLHSTVLLILCINLLLLLP